MRALLGMCVVASLTSVAAAEQVAPPADVAVAIVFNGWEIAMGNILIEKDEVARYPGMLPALANVFDATDIARSLPEHTLALSISYADRAQVRQPLRLLRTLRGEAIFGTQRDYYRTVGNDLVAGVQLGLLELAEVDAKRKFLVVIGDGNTTNMDTGVADLTALRAVAAAAGVEPIAVTYKHVMSDATTVVTALDPDAAHVVSIDGVMRSVRARLETAVASRPASPPVHTCAAFHAKEERDRMLLLGSLALLALLGGTWFIRREKPGYAR